MIPVTVESRLVWRKSPPAEILIPEGTRIRDFLQAIGQNELRGQALLVINRQVCAPDRELKSGDAVVLLSVIDGG